jgi:hypothetical protein
MLAYTIAGSGAGHNNCIIIFLNFQLAKCTNKQYVNYTIFLFYSTPLPKNLGFPRRI